MRNVNFPKAAIFLCFLILTSPLISCKEKEKNFAGHDVNVKTSFSSTKVSCFKLAQQDMTVWDDKGLLNGDNRIDHLLFLADRSSDPTVLQLTVYPFTRADVLIPEGILNLIRTSNCAGLTGNFAIAENYVMLDDLEIVRDGRLVAFGELRLEPRIFAENNALAFHLSVMRGGAPVLERELNPCPPCPYCIPPCRYDVEARDTSKTE